VRAHVPIHTEPADEKYVRIVDTFDHGNDIYYGKVLAKTTPDALPEHKQDYFIVEMPCGKQQIHPCYSCTEITEKEYFYAVLGGKV
jgi:hypothetical protein